MDCQSLQLESKSTIIRAEDLHAKLESILASGHDVQIDASQVENIDTSAMQQLVCLSLMFKQEGRKLVWDNPPEAVTSAARLLGLTTELAMD